MCVWHREFAGTLECLWFGGTVILSPPLPPRLMIVIDPFTTLWRHQVTTSINRSYSNDKNAKRTLKLLF